MTIVAYGYGIGGGGAGGGTITAVADPIDIVAELAEPIPAATGITAIADAIELELSLDDPTAIVADLVVAGAIDLIVDLQVEAEQLPPPGPPLPIISDGGQWGGIITARPLPDFAEDEALLISKGFQITSAVEHAGRTVVRGWVPNSQLMSCFLETDFLIKLPGTYWKLQAGLPLNDETIRKGPVPGQDTTRDQLQ